MHPPRSMFAIAFSASAVLFATSISGCGNGISSEFDTRRTSVLTDPGPAPAGWAPDGVLHMSPALVDDMIKAGLEHYGDLSGSSQVRGPLGVNGTITHDMSVRRVDLAGTSRCERCIEVGARIAGDVDYRFGPLRGSTPVVAVVSLDVRVDAIADRDAGWTVSLAPQTVNDVSIEVRGLAAGVRGAVEDELTTWAREVLLARTEPIVIGTFGGEDFPIRALTVDATATGGVSMQFLTRSSSYAPLGDSEMKIRDGWQLDISQASLVGIAAKASLDAGELSHGVYAEPTALSVGNGDFELGLRLWRPSRTGWWRDYSITGDILIQQFRFISVETFRMASRIEMARCFTGIWNFSNWKFPIWRSFISKIPMTFLIRLLVFPTKKNPVELLTCRRSRRSLSRTPDVGRSTTLSDILNLPVSNLAGIIQIIHSKKS